MGVSLALHKLDAELDRAKNRLVMLGPIIHNPQVLATYCGRGVLCAENLDDIHAGDTVIIRAHGIPRTVEAQLLELKTNLVDATCPRVKRAQLAIAEATANGQPLFLFGEADHPEVRGLVSYAGGSCVVFGDAESFHLPQDVGSSVLAAQTTQDQVAFERLCARLGKEKYPPQVLSTICDATRKRQEEALAIAEQVEIMIIVGSRQSGNTRRLVDVVRSCGIPALHIENPEEIRQEDSLRKYSVAGITAGASTPRQLIDEVQRLLEHLS